MLQEPLHLLVFPVAAAFALWLLAKEFLPGQAGKRWPRVVLGASRLFVIALLTIALAGPYTTSEIFSSGSPRLTVLVDDSASMQALDTTAVQALLDDLEAQGPVDIRRVGTERQSPLGGAALSAIEEGGSVVLISDGRVTDGPTLESVASFAASRQASISAVRLPAQGFDAAVTIQAPQKTVADNELEATVRLTTTRDRPVPVRILVDGVPVEEREAEGSFTLTRSFDPGEHVITARILTDDLIAENNEYRVTVSVVPRPRILYLSQKASAVSTLLGPLYSLEARTSLPDDLSGYYAIILNDVPLQGAFEGESLARFVQDGGGLVVLGGERSYDRGNYAGSSFERLLPVRVGAGERTQGGANIVVAIDLSGSTRGSVTLERVGGETVEVASTEELQSLEKALAVSIISELNPSNKVGVLGFVYGGQTQPCPPDGLCVVRPLSLLGKEKQDVIDRIARVDVTGNTALSGGVRGSWEMLREAAGGKNVIFISDGVSSALDHEQALSGAELIASQGGQVYAVQVGDSDNGGAFLQELARTGRGAFFKASKANRLSVLFGEPVDIEQGDAFDVVVINQFHFITDDPAVQDLSAVLYGYNQVAPKPGASLLVASAGGDPILSTWWYGVGRVAAVTGYNGPDLGALLSGNNSRLLVRTVNWAIGDPERLQDVEVSVPDATVGERIPVRVRADRIPRAQNLSFDPDGRDSYVAYVEHDAPGVYAAVGRSYAVNYPLELSAVGYSPALDDAVERTGGAWYGPGDAAAIYEGARAEQLLVESQRHPIAWVFLAAAALLFVVEVCVRRIRKMRS